LTNIDPATLRLPGNPVTKKRQLLRTEYGALFDALSTILFESDPIGINYETNTDEYDSEVGTIIPRLLLAKSEDDAMQIIHEEFCRWFEPDTAGPMSAYKDIAAKIWIEWQTFLASR
jgi:hypothetical protein